MKQTINIPLILFILITVGGIYFYERSPEVTKTEAPTQTPEDIAAPFTVYEKAELGLAFEYQTGSDGYTLYERTGGDGSDAQVASLMLVHENQRPMVEDPTMYSEGPINISIEVFENSLKQFPRAWAEEHTAYSNLSLVLGEISETVIGGANALRYRVDGLYQMDVAVVAHGSKMYVLSASYLDTESPTYRDFDPLLTSLRFIPEPGQR